MLQSHRNLARNCSGSPSLITPRKNRNRKWPRMSSPIASYGLCRDSSAADPLPYVGRRWKSRSRIVRALDLWFALRSSNDWQYFARRSEFPLSDFYASGYRDSYSSSKNAEEFEINRTTTSKHSLYHRVSESNWVWFVNQTSCRLDQSNRIDQSTLFESCLEEKIWKYSTYGVSENEVGS